LGEYTDNAEFKIFTGNLNFEKGKYYVYNSVSNGYDVPPMEEGGVTSGDLSVETYILDNTTHPYYIGGRIHNNNESIVKKGIIVSTDKDNLKAVRAFISGICYRNIKSQNSKVWYKIKRHDTMEFTKTDE
jgi:hypothetical protein